jgi:hypothetical protein
MTQTHRRKLRFSLKAEIPSPDEQRRFVEAAKEVAARQETISDLKSEAKADTLFLRWSYGPVLGGWPSDGEKFVVKVRELAAVTPVSQEPVRIVHEEKEPRFVEGGDE